MFGHYFALRPWDMGEVLIGELLSMYGYLNSMGGDD